MAIRYRGGELLSFRGDVVMLAHFSDIRPLKGTSGQFDWNYNANLSHLWKKRPDLLDHGSLTLIPAQGKIPAGKVILAGLGKREEFSSDLRTDIYRTAIMAAQKLGARSFATEGIPLGDELDEAVIDDFRSSIDSINALGKLDISLFLNDRSILNAAKKDK